MSNKKKTKEIKEIKEKQLKALETIFDYLNENIKNKEISQSILDDIYDDEKDLLKELEEIKISLSKC
tara:strand:+ start:1592 stop:1792 length:201 start_codon:yes stop_codon:yes gene_type:complete